MNLKPQFERARHEGLLALLTAAAQAHHLPTAYVLGVASRETNIRNILGDAGHGHGVMQIDDRFHGEILAAHPDWRTHPGPLINYGVGLLAGNGTWAGSGG